MSDALRRLKVRISACRATLSTLHGNALITASASQRDAIMYHLHRSRLSGEETAQAIDELANANLRDQDLETVMNALQQRSSGTGLRRCNQDLLAWSAYLTADQWQTFRACDNA